jgi:hypothetical protein
MAGSGNFLAEFNDFVEGTGPTYLKTPRDVILEAVKHTYNFGEMLYGSTKKVVRGGSNIRQGILFKDNGSFESYKPGQSHTWTNPQDLTKAQAGWRFDMGHKTYTEQEIMLNDAVRYGTAESRFHQYVDIDQEKEAAMQAAVWNGLENTLFAQPDKATMEPDKGLDQYSIWAIVNEDANGLWGENFTGNTWTTVLGLDPTASIVDGKWKPQRQQYSSTQINNASNIISRMDDLWQDISFKKPKTHAEYWETEELRNQKIWTSKRGRSVFMQFLRAGQDHFIAGPQDSAYPDPQFMGIPVQRAEGTETAKVFDDGSNGVTTEFAATNKGPRYLLLNCNYLFPVVHDERFFYRDKPSRHHNVPDTWVVAVAFWWNLFCNSRQRQGILYPSGSMYTS